jgi:DNA-binding NarL/FixJ family response regulator
LIFAAYSWSRRQTCFAPSFAAIMLLGDVVMPRMSGPELAQAIRSLCPDLRVLLVSGYGETAFRDGDPFGAQQTFFQKPFGSVDLLAKIRQVLDGGGGAGRTRFLIRFTWPLPGIGRSQDRSEPLNGLHGELECIREFCEHLVFGR